MMSRPITDAPSSLNGPRAKERHGASRSAVSLEAQLWIEVSLLIAFGLIMIYSASSAMAFKKFGDTAYYVKRQFLWIGLGTVVMILAGRIPYGWYRHSIQWMLIAVLAALTLVLVPELGAKINNARRWFQFRYFSVQPAEYAKVIWVIYLSVSLTKKQEKIKQISIGFLPHIIVCAVLGFLLLLEPDFGTAFMLGVLTLLMLAVGGVPFRHLSLLAPIASLVFYYFVYLVHYRWERITAFRDPWTDPLDSGYQLIQAWIAVGSGGVWGKGLGAGQQKLFYLPESYTDFILAVVGEELGFLGILTVAVLFLLLFCTGLRISQSAPDWLGTLLALGLTMLLSLQAMINMGVVLGLVPTKGLPLPFISYGGSAFTANCLAIGILINIARRCERRIVKNV